MPSFFTPDIICWLIAIVVFIIVEAVTVSLVSLWFIGGAVGALIAAMLGGSTLVQLTVFVLLSAVLLILLRPMAKRHLVTHHTPTNADRLIGKTAVVTEPIDPLHGTGAVKVEGVLWSARCDGNSVIAPGTLVRIQEIDGSKVYVEALPVPVSAE